MPVGRIIRGERAGTSSFAALMMTHFGQDDTCAPRNTLKYNSGLEGRTSMALKICLHCRLQLPDATIFCPECGKPIENAVRFGVLSGVDTERSKQAHNGTGALRRTTEAKSCLYCCIQLPDRAAFCPECGRPVESCYKIRPMQNCEFDNLHTELTENSESVGTSHGS